jgi:quercetin dioxygenase-like cupin family protein
MSRSGAGACLIILGLAAPALAQSDAGRVALDNAFVLVSRNAAPCAEAAIGRCEDRIIVAMGAVELRYGGMARKMARGEIAIFEARQSYAPPLGDYFEIAIKPNHPPATAPAELIAPKQPRLLYEGPDFFIYEERLAIGATRPRHSHSERVEIRINQGPQLEQKVWTGDKQAMVEPSIVNFRQPVVHEVTNRGDMPLFNLIVEFVPKRR